MSGRVNTTPVREGDNGSGLTASGRKKKDSPSPCKAQSHWHVGHHAQIGVEATKLLEPLPSRAVNLPAYPHNDETWLCSLTKAWNESGGVETLAMLVPCAGTVILLLWLIVQVSHSLFTDPAPLVCLGAGFLPDNLAAAITPDFCLAAGPLKKVEHSLTAIEAIAKTAESAAAQSSREPDKLQKTAAIVGMDSTNVGQDKRTKAERRERNADSEESFLETHTRCTQGCYARIPNSKTSTRVGTLAPLNDICNSTGAPQLVLGTH